MVGVAEMARGGVTDAPIRDLASDWMWEESKNRLAFLVCSRLESRMAGRMNDGAINRNKIGIGGEAGQWEVDNFPFGHFEVQVPAGPPKAAVQPEEGHGGAQEAPGGTCAESPF